MAMQILSSHKEFEKKFGELQKKYGEYYWAVAWAGKGFDSFNNLKDNKAKIREITVGLHFYQTHPDFIKEFIDDDKIRYNTTNTDGTFHPKVYLFQNDDTDWAIIIGSPNFTEAAFTKNEEISVLISSKDGPSGKMYEDVKRYIHNCWENGMRFDEDKWKEYRKSWGKKQKTINSLSGNNAPEIRIQSLSWQDFVKRVKSERGRGGHNVGDRLGVIGEAKMLFEGDKKLVEMGKYERRFIAGTLGKRQNEKFIADTSAKRNGATLARGCGGVFGGMRGCGEFAQKIKENNEIISLALEQIPRSGAITRKHYSNFVEHFKQLFSKNIIAPATRLLCMKRPDYFVCFNTKNEVKLRKDFGIEGDINLESYWDEIIVRIMNCDWWKTSNKPSEDDPEELAIWNARVAFLDSIYYEG